jgi:hypothetical protein
MKYKIPLIDRLLICKTAQQVESAFYDQTNVTYQDWVNFMMDIDVVAQGDWPTREQIITFCERHGAT